jgi:hypothetical protein
MASHPQDLDRVFEDWPYQPGAISARIVRCRDGRHVLQMRIEMGVLQMEMEGRPDRERPDGAETYLDLLLRESLTAGDDFVLSEEQCFEVDREFLQFYHRRICLLALREFRRAICDADHTLALMDFAAAHSPDEEWTLSHEQYRPFVLFHRTQAAALEALKEDGAEVAIEQCNQGLERIRQAFEMHDVEEQFEDDELVGQIVNLKEALRKEYDVGPTLDEQLADAVAKEEYERAARLRDQIARRTRKA